MTLARVRMRMRIGGQKKQGTPHITYAGFLFKDLFAIWTAEQDRIFSDPLPKPAVVAPRPAPAPAAKARTMTATGEPLAMDHGFGWTRRQPCDEPVAEPEPPTRPKRMLRRDAPPADGSQRQVQILRKGLELPDGTQSVAGDVLTVAAEHATLMVKAGAAEFATSGDGK